MEGSRPSPDESIFTVTARTQRRAYSVPRTGAVLPEPRTFSIARIATAAPAPRSHDAMLIAILDAPLLPGETAHAGFLRKEAELGNALATLTVLEARTLHARLASPKSNDALADKFSRLTIERRTRLLTFLANARRREAIAIARR